MTKGLFHGYWYTLEGRKIRRATRNELRLAYKIWATNQDIREGLMHETRPTQPAMVDRS